MDKPSDQFNHALSDFIGRKKPACDHIGVFASPPGMAWTRLCKEFERDHDDYNSIMTKALADRLARPLPSACITGRIEWGYGATGI